MRRKRTTVIFLVYLFAYLAVIVPHHASEIQAVGHGETSLADCCAHGEHHHHNSTQCQICLSGGQVLAVTIEISLTPPIPQYLDATPEAIAGVTAVRHTSRTPRAPPFAA